MASSRLIKYYLGVSPSASSEQLRGFRVTGNPRLMAVGTHPVLRSCHPADVLSPSGVPRWCIREAGVNSEYASRDLAQLLSLKSDPWNNATAQLKWGTNVTFPPARRQDESRDATRVLREKCRGIASPPSQSAGDPRSATLGFSLELLAQRSTSLALESSSRAGTPYFRFLLLFYFSRTRLSTCF